MIELKLTNQEVTDLDKALEQSGSIKGCAQFAMSVALNRLVLQPFINVMKELTEAPKEYKEFIQERQKIVEKLGTESIQAGQQVYTFTDDDALEEYNSRVYQLEVDYHMVIEKYKARIKDFEETILPNLANSGEAIKFHPLPKGLPDELDGNTVFALIKLVETT